LKKEAANSLKKKKHYEEYLNNLKKIEYEREMKILKKDIDKSKKELVIFYNLTF
jgi:hypothetical protein